MNIFRRFIYLCFLLFFFFKDLFICQRAQAGGGGQQAEGQGEAGSVRGSVPGPWDDLSRTQPLNDWATQAPQHRFWALWKGSHYAQTTLKGAESDGSPIWVWCIYINYLEFFCTGDLFVLSHSFIQSFIFISMDSWNFYTLGCNPVPLYFVAQVIPALPIKKK